MKKVYWRPHRVARVELVLIAALAVAGLSAVNRFLVVKRQSHYDDKMRAARLAQRSFEELNIERIRREISVAPQSDPTMMGLIGLFRSPITTNPGFLTAKQTSVNPNFAAMVLEMLLQAHVRAGDVVAVGLSGSFPALNVSVYAALQTLGVRPIAISSVGASQWGANDPRFTWLDMESVLRERDLISFRSVAASRGGVDDCGTGIEEPSLALLDEAMMRNRVLDLRPSGYLDSVEKRMATYAHHADQGVVKAYVNVGGNTASVGTSTGKHSFKPGLNLDPPRRRPSDSVMLRFVTQGVPVIHLVGIKDLAERYGFPVAPTALPRPGEGKVFVRPVFNTYLVVAVLLLILGAMYAVIRVDLGFRLLRASRSEDTDTRPPEQMV